jgi:hypothetical protein
MLCMTRTPDEFTYTRIDLAQISEWTEANVRKAEERKELDVADIRSIAIWLARNGPASLRAEIASAVVNDIMAGLADYMRDNILHGRFARSGKMRKERGRNIAEGKSR